MKTMLCIVVIAHAVVGYALMAVITFMFSIMSIMVTPNIVEIIRNAVIKGRKTKVKIGRVILYAICTTVCWPVYWCWITKRNFNIGRA